MSTTVTVWPRLGTTVTLSDGVTVIDQHGATLLYTPEIRDLLREGLLLDYDPRDVPEYDPSVPVGDGGITAFNFSHPAFSVAGAATRRLWTGWSTATWAAGDAWKSRYVIPEPGHLVSLTTQHGAHTQPASIAYTVWWSYDFGASWWPTDLAVAVDANNNGPGYIAGAFSVGRGDLIGVEAICSAATTSTDRLNASVLYRGFV